MPGVMVQFRESSKALARRFIDPCRTMIYTDIVCRQLLLAEPGTILDIGCGNGLVAEVVAQALPNSITVGVDSYRWNIDYMLPQSSIRGGARFCCADCNCLPFRDGSVDAIVSISLIEHLASAETYVREVRRVLRSKGLLVLQAPNLQYLIEPHSGVPLLYLMPRKLQSRILFTHDRSLNMTMTTKKILQLFHDAGFVEKKRIPVYALCLLKILPIAPSYFFVFERADNS